MSSKLNRITKQLGTAHRKKTEAEKKLKEQRNKFFEAIDNEIITTETLAQQTISIPDDVENTENYIKQFYPGWRIVGGEYDVSTETIIIEEDPAFKKFVYVNQEDGQIYRRNISQSGPSLDDERLKEEQPELWNRVTYVSSTRILKDLDTLSDEDLSEMQKYFVPGSMTVKLDAPRKAKLDELNI